MLISVTLKMWSQGTSLLNPPCIPAFHFPVLLLIQVLIQILTVRYLQYIVLLNNNKYLLI